METFVLHYRIRNKSMANHLSCDTGESIAVGWFGGHGALAFKAANTGKSEEANMRAEHGCSSS